MIITLLKYTRATDPHVEAICQALESKDIDWKDCPPAFATVEQGDKRLSGESNEKEYCVCVYPQLPSKPILPRTIVDIITTIETNNPMLCVRFVKFGDRLGTGFETVSIELHEESWVWDEEEWKFSEDDIATFTDPASPFYEPMNTILNSPELNWSNTPKKYLLETRPREGFRYMFSSIKIGGEFVGRDFLANLLEAMCNSSLTLLPTTCLFFNTLLNDEGWKGIILNYSDVKLQSKFFEDEKHKEIAAEIHREITSRIKEGMEYTNVLIGWTHRLPEKPAHIIDDI